MSEKNISEISDISSEAGVIGTLIIKPEFIAHIGFLKPNHFYERSNSCIYWALTQLFEEGITTFDAFNISNKLESNRGVHNTIEKFNLPNIQELIELYQETARTSIEELKMLAKNVATLAFKRELVKTLNVAKAHCFDTSYTLEKLSNSVYSALDELARDFVADERIETIGAKIDDIWEEIESRRANGCSGLPSKYPSFAKYFSYEIGELVVVQGSYKAGKSILMMNEVYHKLKNGVACLVVDSEMSTRQYTERLISHITGVEVRKIKSGGYSEEDGAKIAEALAWLKKQNLVHLYSPETDMERLYSICKILQNKMNLGFVCYDYLKCNSGTSSDIYNRLGADTDFLKNKIAGELQLPVLAGAQLNRAGEIADSMKINRFLSTGIKWTMKTPEQIARDGLRCGNALAKIYVNRLGEQMQEDDEDDYIDFLFEGNIMSITEAQQHTRTNEF